MRPEGGRGAIALARMLVARNGELTVAYVSGEEPRDPGTRSGSAVASVRRHAVEVLERACAGTGIEAHIRWRGFSSVGRGLYELAEMTEADLLVVGSYGRGLVGRVRRGDHTRARR